MGLQSLSFLSYVHYLPQITPYLFSVVNRCIIMAVLSNCFNNNIMLLILGSNCIIYVNDMINLPLSVSFDELNYFKM